ncbi:MAG: hypothetical protein HQ498_08600 [Pseudohongiella sp.]|nr:hypothetical protein [Pseudohongiella sp.]
MKTTLSCLLVAVLSTYWVHSTAIPLHGIAKGEARSHAKDSASVSIRQNDGALCGTPFYDDLYALTVAVFAIGAENVKVSEYEQQVFALIRSAEEFEGTADAFVEHVKDIPRQLVEIIREDSAVLDSCSNFSVALVGPP